MEFYFQAKAELNTCASMNGQIPWTAIRDYAQTYGLDIEEFEGLVQMVRAMEAGGREAEAEEPEARPEGPAESSGVKPRPRRRGRRR